MAAVCFVGVDILIMRCVITNTVLHSSVSVCRSTRFDEHSSQNIKCFYLWLNERENKNIETENSSLLICRRFVGFVHVRIWFRCITQPIISTNRHIFECQIRMKMRFLPPSPRNKKKNDERTREEKWKRTKLDQTAKCWPVFVFRLVLVFSRCQPSKTMISCKQNTMREMWKTTRTVKLMVQH